jgi:hypothetical protein
MAGFKLSALGRRTSVPSNEFQVQISGLGTTSTGWLFTAPPGKRFLVTRFGARWTTKSSVSGAIISLERVASAIAPGSGTDIKATSGGVTADATENIN